MLGEVSKSERRSLELVFSILIVINGFALAAFIGLNSIPYVTELTEFVLLQKDKLW